MSRFNLIDEPWISVVIDYKGTTKLVGLKEFFENAHTYIALAGDMPTQDFAVMRFILAILHTVFSRYDAQGNAYETVTLNDRMQQLEEVDQGDYEDYEDALLDTWKDLWKAGKFPDIVLKYLDAWHDRFYLYDDKYPFYQVTKEIISKVNAQFTDNTCTTAIVCPKLINRTISESGNKIALFSPRCNSNKNNLTDAELVRWLITFQAVSNASDKKSIIKDKTLQKSIGWIYGLGGLFFSSNNLFKTLLFNFILKHPDSQYNVPQHPAWELEQYELYEKYQKSIMIDNLACLYTNWSRLVYLFYYTGNKKESKDKESRENLRLRIVKTIAPQKETNILEPMAKWKNGSDKIPIADKPQKTESIWRSFGAIFNLSDNDRRSPVIADNLNHLKEYFDEDELVQVNVISAIDDGKQASRALVEEYHDNFNLKLYVATDLIDRGWVVRINHIIETTKDIIEKDYGHFLSEIKTIRNINFKDFVLNKKGALYFKIDKPFKDWLANIDCKDNKDAKEQEWYTELRQIIRIQVYEFIKNASLRDFIGVVVKDKEKNIALALNMFMVSVNKKLPKLDNNHRR
ncbi:type I-E CRISPR-associated protein Cse1/CasA [Fannyhessea vaginae]|uniref:type I-E CRISPR-associated protein Cse1/CasA n=1 Tax=Fannyhessea vaginae TaxID=82135 RepID=UPI0026EDC672|nr:type I-E CRISPR-associated protein Cse1/CasA [Fannyhessea vaginae]